MVSKFKLKHVSKSFNNIDELNPEVLKMLEKMIEEKNKSVPMDDAIEEAAVTKSNNKLVGDDSEGSISVVPKLKIALSDKEFGKY